MSRALSRYQWQISGLLFIVLACFALRLHELTYQDIWWDEARNIDVALRPLTRVANAPELDIHPPVYFWILHLLGQAAGLQVGDDPTALAFATRYLSVGAGVVGVTLIFQLARLTAQSMGSATAGVMAAAVAAFSPFWLAESQETRMYTVGFALLTAAGVALLYALDPVPNTGGGKPRSTAADSFAARYRFHTVFVILSALALMTHYNVVFVLVAWYLWWLLWALTQADRRRQLATLLICGSSMTLLIAPIAPIALRQIPGYENPDLIAPNIVQYLTENWRAYLGGYAFNPTTYGRGTQLWLWSMAAVLIGGLTLRRGDGWRLFFLLAWLAGGLALYYIAVVDRGAFNVRYSSFVTPALYATLGMALHGIGRIWRPLTPLMLALLLLGFAIADRADLYDERFAREDIRGVTDWLRANTGPDDVIFVDQKYPFGFYYERYAIDADAVPAGAEAAPARYLFVDINTVAERLNSWAGDAERVFWVQWFESDTDPRRSVSFLLDQAGVRTGEKNFRGYSVDWWTLTPPSEFALAQTFAPLDIRFEQGIRTTELALPAAPLSSGETLFAVIRWARSDSKTERPLKARLALYNSNGERVAQGDERILNDRHLMPAEWAPGDNPLNVYKIATQRDLAPGTYSLGLVIYDAETLAPFGFLDEAGNPAGVEVTIGTVIVAGDESDRRQPARPVPIVNRRHHS